MTRTPDDLLRGTLDALILKTLSWGPRHGYGIAGWIKATSHDALAVEDRALYLALHRLEDKGWVESHWGQSDNNRRAKFYELTAAGPRPAPRRVVSTHSIHSRPVSRPERDHVDDWLMPREIDRDVDDEIAFHLESRVGELMARGQSEQTARRNAETEFGDVRASRRELAAVDRHRRRRERVARGIDTAAQNLRQAGRSLQRSPAFTITATLTLAIGMGSSVAIFALVNGVLLRPLPYGRPDRLVAASHDLQAIGMTHQPQTISTYFTYQRLARTIEGIGLYRESEVNIAELGGTAEPQRVTAATISATLIPVLEVAPLIGQAFTAADDRRGAPPVVLIGAGLWQARFGADPNIIGRKLDVNGVAREIVGVMPAHFHFPAATELWVPSQLDPLDPPGAGFEYGAVARLRAGVTAEDAQRDFAAGTAAGR